jgi:dTDP-4-dehydrorhamnose 3,5-epimerase
MKTPILFEGGLAIDDRGELRFVNDFHFDDVKRFYTVRNHRKGFIRAWHAHKLEAKYVLVLQGAAIVGAVPIDNWEAPSKNAVVSRYFLSASKPTILYIPSGYANGFMSLTDDLLIQFFSTSSLEESKVDDIRFEARYWNIWDVVER